MRPAQVVLGWLAILLAGCAVLTVTKVSRVDDTAPGLRYSLPKPFIQVVPQSDGTLSVGVVYLPDANHTYAISTSAYFATYAFQVVLEQGGFLSKIELKQNTAAVPQQAAATAGAMTAQAINLQSAQMAASQTAVDGAQSAVDEARTAVATADAKLRALEAQSSPPVDQLNSARSEFEQAKAKLRVKEDALRRAQTTARVVATQAQAGTPITTSAAALGTPLVPPTWTTPIVYPIAGDKGAVLFAVNEGVVAGKPFVRLEAARIDGVAQPQFKTTRIAAVSSTESASPQLTPKDKSFPRSGSAEFTFSAAIARITSQRLEVAPTQESAAASVVDNAPQAQYDATTKKVTLPLAALPKQRYKLSLFYEYSDAGATKKGDAFVHFIVE